ncbi:uncharacterized protein LOC131254885 [Magnolia sinica]|uniref:uncharacterized protein LOC131254885 n=1 Tax=Magnolia sinica TaxID=86752 RepID=UPI00265A9259|nr:uncharacterized protein LOC131254885 [Magnolia sinica]
MTENIAFAQEVLRDLNRKVRGGNIVLKLDLEKAYDMVDWEFLKQVLRKFSFYYRWITLMERCWGNSWFSILIIAEVVGFFKSSRGLHQGDPLSLGLFILTADAFSRSFKFMMVRGWSQLFQIRRGFPLASHLLFMDGTLSFLNGSRASILRVKALLNEFQAASGQRINLSKTSFICLDKLPAGRIISIERVLGINRCTARICYLGVPLSMGRIKSSDFQFLLDKVDHKISRWKVGHLSQAGKATLIHHILSSIPLHVMATGIVPTQVISKLERSFARFFWGWADGRQKLH